ncbi:MAG: AmmeMemoRadiSam system radical SAM enzyme [Candidatus Marinimicrobia bacterium]|nr:AmmeMemoRadiSam system radical SAM enzyme [Candidatus Neomarinimicrobiota bacterium]
MMLDRVACGLCPKGCVLADGQNGACRVRGNRGGTVISLTDGHPCALHVDPIEKKPLFHFLPGSRTLSLATAGCNLSCLYCQNAGISQEGPAAESMDGTWTAEDVVRLAQARDCATVAYTYTEPIVYFEYALACARAARAAGLRNVMVSAAYCNPGPWGTLCRAMDAVNVDLKALSDAFYREVCGARLEPVLKALVQARDLGLLVEVTNLVIPTLNDGDEALTALCRWVWAELGPATPLHFSGFFPQHRLRHLPPTPPATLLRARELARAEGLRHVYLGNLELPDGANTHCANCDALLIERRGYSVRTNRLEPGGVCPACGAVCAGVWS